MAFTHKGSLALSFEAAVEVRRLYAEVDSRGRKVHSYRSLGKMFAVSETTILRCVNAQGPFMAMQDELPPAQLKAKSEASLARLNKLLADAPPVEDKPDPLATLSPETKAKAEAIEAKLKLGNS